MAVVNGQWQPDLFPKQWVGLRATLPSKRNRVLFCGPRKSTKTICAGHAFLNHAWNTNMANMSVLTVTQSVGVDSGVWEKLVKLFIPQWIGGNFGMHYIKEPFLQGVTKKPTLILSNRWGNESKLSLESLKEEAQVEDRFKGKEYSCIWVNELSKFKARRTFDVLKDCLRGNPYLKPEEYLFLADTNPDLDLGAESWIYKLWYELRNDANCPEELKPIRDSLELVEFTVDDNLSMTKEDKALLLSDYSHDQDLVAAYYFGKWVTASADAIFFKVFRPHEHVIGDDATVDDDDPVMLLPEEDCIELHTGWDPGPVNCAGVIIEAPTLPNNRPTIKVLDEHVIVRGGPNEEGVDLKAFVETMMEKMQYWEKIIGRPVQWVHHSDRSVFDQQDWATQKYYHQLIYDYSDEKIVLEAFERAPGSVPAGIDLVKMLFWSDRIHINRPKCPKLIEAFKGIKKGKQANQPIAKGSVHKHPFDAFRYVVQTICYDEIRRTILQRLGKEREAQSSVVTVPVSR